MACAIRHHRVHHQNGVGKNETITLSQCQHGVFEHGVVSGLCTRPHCHACSRVAHGHARNGCVLHADSQSNTDANQHPCATGVAHTHTRTDHHANTDTNSTPRPNCHTNTAAHSNPHRHNDTHARPNANIHSCT
jgi:hypothetical protein